MKRLFIPLAIAAVVGVIGVVIAWNSIWQPTCDATVLSEQKSPNETFLLSLFIRNCGATTDYVTGISVRRVGNDFEQSIDDAILIITGDVPVAASWVDDDRIEINIPKGADIFRRAQNWEGIMVTYRTN